MRKTANNIYYWDDSIMERENFNRRGNGVFYGTRNNGVIFKNLKCEEGICQRIFLWKERTIEGITVLFFAKKKLPTPFYKISTTGKSTIQSNFGIPSLEVNIWYFCKEFKFLRFDKDFRGHCILTHCWAK